MSKFSCHFSGVKAALLLLGMVCKISLAFGETEDFESTRVGESPKGWETAITGEGQPDWTVKADDSAPSPSHVFKQSAETPRPSFPIALKRGSALGEGFVEVKFKTVAGKIDQAAGVIWRARDKNNYYICRANALENNVVLYKVEKGKRIALDILGRQGGYGVEAMAVSKQWQTLRVQFKGDAFQVFLNGKPLFEVQDRTFQSAGMVGLWTKADSVVLFDDFSFGSLESGK